MNMADHSFVEDEQKLASFLERGLAIFIDGLIILIFSFMAYSILFIDVIGPLFLLVLPNAYEFGPHVAFLFWLIIVWLYYACMECSRYQGTVGKYLLKLNVTDEHGERLTFKETTIRFIIKIGSFLIVFAGFVTALFTQKKQTLHDLAAHTVVIKVKNRP